VAGHLQRRVPQQTLQVHRAHAGLQGESGECAPQLGSQAFLGLAALWLLADEGRRVEIPVHSTDRLRELEHQEIVNVQL
jgi:hypothetical protein